MYIDVLSVGLRVWDWDGDLKGWLNWHNKGQGWPANMVPWPRSHCWRWLAGNWSFVSSHAKMFVTCYLVRYVTWRGDEGGYRLSDGGRLAATCRQSTPRDKTGRWSCATWALVWQSCHPTLLRTFIQVRSGQTWLHTCSMLEYIYTCSFCLARGGQWMEDYNRNTECVGGTLVWTDPSTLPNTETHTIWKRPKKTCHLFLLFLTDMIFIWGPLTASTKS